MSTDEERICSIALTQIPGVGHIGAKRLVDGMGSAADVFRYRTELPDRLPGVNQAVVAALDSPQALKRAEQEYEFVRDNRISCLTMADEGYPSRLRECDDAPVVLFFKGKADLNAFHIINMVGTRNATDYGKQICVSFLQDLQALSPDVLVVSGLAYGIDINAHRAALAVELPTVGVLAHGLDRIYPSLHRKTAIDMLRQGGLLTEFLSGTNPDKHNFISRNRIVAGISDATIVVESAAKGGSLITADIAGSYHRDCFAFPGRVTDEYSKGCNQLIRDNKAVLLESAADFVKAMGWDTGSHTIKPTTVQRNLFPDLSAEELKIVDILGRLGDLQINALMVQADIPINKISVILFELEMKGVIRALAGGVYQLLK
ncbi:MULTISPECIES: DNA-processing protein DprA [Bacteroides]|uniref:DNA-processing protein DprA n=1 Tax=Bacteroides TaxID=816 RepID=UPI0022903290|nr:DNA-processing protein DprA [Bacteroides fragilis]MCY6344950.1 DNA-processing protein DprA [Bacteroides fragilis]MCZ2672866.1 DNA-processing protein DprA [Bacteroides fragilis]